MMKKLFGFLLIFLCFNAQAQLTQIDIRKMSTEAAVASQFFKDGEYEKALSLFEKLYQQNSETYFPLYFNTLLKLKKFDVAEKIVRKEIKSSPDNYFNQILLGKLYQSKGELQKANKTYIDIINTLPAEEYKISALANYFFSVENLDYAIQTYQKGRKLLNNNKAFSYEMISIYRFKKDKAMLIQEYLEVLSDRPQQLEQAQYAFLSIFDDRSDYLNLQFSLLKKIQKEPDAIVFTKLLTWNYIQQKEFNMALRQLIAFDKRNNGDGEILYQTARTFVFNGAYEPAIKAYEYIISKGKDNPYYIDSKIEILNTRYNILLEDRKNVAEIDVLAKDYEALINEFGTNGSTLFAQKKLANLQAYYLNEPSKAEKILETAINFNDINLLDKGILKLDLGDIYIITNQPWEAFLVYEQVSKMYEGQPIGNEARYRSAKLSYYQGNFDYSLAQCLVLKSATSQLIANDALNLSLLITDNTQTPQDSSALKMYADAEMLVFRKKSELAVSKLDSINVIYPQNSLADAILLSKAKILIEQANFETASEILKKITTDFVDGIWTDDALFKLAELYEQKLNNIEEAKNTYQKLITNYPGSMFTSEARKRFRILRGDNNTENKSTGLPAN
jgi:tetratricopeptide (TPR) repeat protein